jgi:hypothetical protein
MRFRTAGWIVALAACGAVALPRPADAADFDPSGTLTFTPGAALAESFEDFDVVEAGSSIAIAVDSETALEGEKVLLAKLRDEGLPLPLSLPSGHRTYQLSFWIRGDVVGGLAVDYGDGRPGNLAQAFPSGRVTSDGWIEMKTSPIPIDGDASGLDARVFLAGYDAAETLSVEVDAVEVIATGDAVAPVACEGLDLAGACGAEEMCLGGRCHAAAGWFPPLPSPQDRDRLVDYWKEKIRDTYGPLLMRKVAMPEALAALENARNATSAVSFWNRFAEAIRRLRDAHTYTRSPNLSRLHFGPALNVCFFEGMGDLSQNAWPTDPAYGDILVSHAGPSHTWGLRQGDRLVAVDGIHPLAWVRSLMSHSLWYWESDEPRQVANLAWMLRQLIPLHATTVSVVHCDAGAKTCDKAATVLQVDAMKVGPPDLKLVGCDNRPFYHVPGAPEDHDFGNAMADESVVLEGWLTQSSSEEGLRGIVWNSLLGGWQGSKLDAKLRHATNTWKSEARGVVMDHRQGHGGTMATANILIGFSRERFMPMASLFRNREADEGPQTLEEGKALFEKIRSYAGVQAGSDNPQVQIPVAFLVTWDVSASDFLPHILKGAPQVRLFGPGPTMGAFGTFFQYSYWGGLRWSLGAEDSLTPEGMTLCGRGVYPDEVVFPRQSDLLEGRDTVHEAAVTWLREEIAP